MNKMTQPSGSVSTYTNKQAIARIFNDKTISVAYLSTDIEISDYKYLFEPIEEKIYLVSTASGIPVDWKIDSSGDLEINTSNGNYTLGVFSIYELYSNTDGSSRIGTTSGKTVQQELDSTDKFAGVYEDGIITVTNVNSWITYDGERWYVKPGNSVPFTTTGNNSTSWESDSSNFVNYSPTVAVQYYNKKVELLFPNEEGMSVELLKNSLMAVKSNSSLKKIIPYTLGSGKLSLYDGSPIRTLVLPSVGMSDYSNSPKLSFVTTANKKVEVWSIHPDEGRNATNYQDISSPSSDYTPNKAQRYRYKLLDVDDLYESAILYRYSPSVCKNVYANYISHDINGYSWFNFFFYFSSSLTSMGINGEQNLFDSVAEPMSKRYLNRYVILELNGKFGVYPVYLFATTSGDNQFVIRIGMQSEPDGTVLTGTSSNISGYYGQTGASPVTYTSVKLISTTEKLVVGTNLTTPYTIANGDKVYINGMGRVDVIKDQSVSSLPTISSDVVSGVTIDTSTTPNTLSVTKASIASPNSNVSKSVLVTHHAKMFAVKDKLPASYYSSTDITLLLGDYASGYDSVLYTGIPQKFGVHPNTDKDYVEG